MPIELFFGTRNIYSKIHKYKQMTTIVFLVEGVNRTEPILWISATKTRWYWQINGKKRYIWVSRHTHVYMSFNIWQRWPFSSMGNSGGPGTGSSLFRKEKCNRLLCLAAFYDDLMSLFPVLTPLCNPLSLSVSCLVWLASNQQNVTSWVSYKRLWLLSY